MADLYEGGNEPPESLKAVSLGRVKPITAVNGYQEVRSKSVAYQEIFAVTFNFSASFTFEEPANIREMKVTSERYLKFQLDNIEKASIVAKCNELSGIRLLRHLNQELQKQHMSLFVAK
ncbi:hypothetical protein ANN_19687 [Periplaneta americana]|uniref:Uncharacterized protein n=1 Tax=Periplaneta americana TaxID=6978 RepID=A0ABQ8SBM2_PERAM|nr:hypothetical protein ANN_19687 [Periplaneta americana]